MNSRRKICIVTGSRAEWGLLRWLAEELARDGTVALQIVATGTHLVRKFGLTRDQIVRDGFTIDAEVPMLLASDDGRAIATSVGLGVIGMSEALSRLAPDIVVVLGDRFEMLAAAEAALFCKIPMAHIHGGEASEGLTDEAVRHSVTKMAHVHFTAADGYRRRVIQLGEAPDRVFNVGAIALDCLAATPPLDRKDVEARLGIAAGCHYFLVTYHPVTLDKGAPGESVREMTAALDLFPDYHVVVTGVNADTGNSEISAAFAEWQKRRRGKLTMIESLGQKYYSEAMRWCDAVVGNSSSGLLEAPALKVPTVNIGVRQRGRIRAASVIDCGESRDELAAALSRALDPEFRNSTAAAPYPFGTPGASRRIADVLRTVRLDGILMKKFHDLPVSA